MKGRYPILSDIAIKILSIPATSAAKKPLTIEGWVEKVLQKKAIREAAKGNNEQEIDVESDFSDLDFQSYSDLEELLDEELNEFQD
ncbi:unnamed protein product [Rhizophagus irregularis]|nr:unnamed protein product [Rhizophagus irregularis]